METTMFLENKHLFMREPDDGEQGGNNNPANGVDNNENDGGNGDEKSFTQEEVDNIVSERVNRAVDKAVNKALQERDDKEREERDEADRMKNMTKQQKADAETQKLRDKIAELEAKQTRSEMSSQARAKLQELDITADDETIGMLVTDKADTTIKNVEGFAKAVEAAVESRYQKDRVGRTPGSSTNPSRSANLDVGQQLAEREKQQNSKAHQAKDLWA